jgi:hypothetical protein
MGVCLLWVLCVLSGRGLWDGPIPRPEESYRLWCVLVCDLESSRIKRPWPALGCSTKGKKKTSSAMHTFPNLQHSERSTMAPNINLPIVTRKKQKQTFRLEYADIRLLGALAKLRKATIRFTISACPNLLRPRGKTGRIFIAFHTWVCFGESVEKIYTALKSDKNKDTLHEEVCTFMTASRWFRLRMRKFPKRSCRENQITHFMLIAAFSVCRAVYEIMWKTMAEPYEQQTR